MPRSRRSTLTARRRQHAVDVLGDGADVVVGQRQRRHPALGAAALDDRRDQLALLVVQHDERAQEIRAAQLAATQIGAVACGAGRGIDRATAFDQRGIAGRALLRRERARLLPTAPALSTAGRRLRRRCLSVEGVGGAGCCCGVCAACASTTVETAHTTAANRLYLEGLGTRGSPEPRIISFGLSDRVPQASIVGRDRVGDLQLQVALVGGVEQGGRAVIAPARSSFSSSPSKCCMPSSSPSRMASSSDLPSLSPRSSTRACASSTSGSRARRPGRRLFGIRRCEMK